MATSSIFEQIRAKDKKTIRKLVSAMERSRASKVPEVQMSRTPSDMTKEEIQKIFGETERIYRV